MNAHELQRWQTLKAHFATLRQANDRALPDVPGSGYDIQLSTKQITEESRRFSECESRINEAIANRSPLTWWFKRRLLGKHCREVYTWFDRSTDDNFNWTHQGQAIRAARDEVARCLTVLGF